MTSALDNQTQVGAILMSIPVLPRERLWIGSDPPLRSPGIQRCRSC